MTGPALLAFLGIIVLFVLFSLYIFARLIAIRLPGDRANLAMTVYIILATAIIVTTLIYLVKP